MPKKSAKKKFLERDRLVKVMSDDGFFRAAIVRNSNAAVSAQLNHSLPDVPAIVLARALSGASLAASLLKGEERVVLQIDAAGAVGKVYAEALQVGETRGFVDYSPKLPSMNIESLESVFGAGTFSLSKILYNKTKPLTGVVPLQKGDVAADLAYYYAQSEQIPTGIVLDVITTSQGIIYSSGGVLVQATPGAEEERIREVVESLSSIGSLCDKFKTEMDLEKVIKDVLPFNFKKIGSTIVDYFCRCSKEKFMDKLKALQVDELEQMRDNGENELVCRYCGANYYLDGKDFRKIIEEIQAKKN